jgi:hypothetical protein
VQSLFVGLRLLLLCLLGQVPLVQKLSFGKHWARGAALALQGRVRFVHLVVLWCRHAVEKILLGLEAGAELGSLVGASLTARELLVRHTFG